MFIFALSLLLFASNKKKYFIFLFLLRPPLPKKGEVKYVCTEQDRVIFFENYEFFFFFN